MERLPANFLAFSYDIIWMRVEFHKETAAFCVVNGYYIIYWKEKHFTRGNLLILLGMAGKFSF